PGRVRGVLADLASGSGSTHILDTWIEYECPEDASTVLSVESGDEPTRDLMTCPTSGHDLRLADCNPFVTFRPTHEFSGGTPSKKGLGGLSALRRRLSRKTP